MASIHAGRQGTSCNLYASDALKKFMAFFVNFESFSADAILLNPIDLPSLIKPQKQLKYEFENWNTF